MKRPVAKLATLILSLTVGIAYVAHASNAVADSGKCTIAVKGTSPTAKACAKGGRDEAKKVMKEMVKAAGAKGVKFTCVSCHEDTTNYELSKNAVADYKKLQDASGMK
jgi:DNA-directed RNA polymerase subunit M/transcription elongation factor TFIIS